TEGDRHFCLASGSRMFFLNLSMQERRSRRTRRRRRRRREEEEEEEEEEPPHAIEEEDILFFFFFFFLLFLLLLCFFFFLSFPSRVLALSRLTPSRLSVLFVAVDVPCCLAPVCV